MNRGAVVLVVLMVLVLSGMGFASVDVVGDFTVKESDQPYAYEFYYHAITSQGYPGCPCDVSATAAECGDRFFTDVDLGEYCHDAVPGFGFSIYQKAFVPSLDFIGGNVGINNPTPGFGLDVEKVTGNTVAKFGSTFPVYMVHNSPNVGFNAYYNGGWKYGKGSSGHYGGVIYFNPGNGNFTIQTSTNTGNADASTALTDLMVLGHDGTMTLNNIPAGSTSNYLCAGAPNSGRIERCSSTRTLKTDIRDLDVGLGTVGKLHPVLFNWKKTGQPDLGFIAEEVADVSPVLATYNEQGAPEGVKYMNMTAVLVKAAQEQQQMISDLKKSLSEKDEEIQSLKKAISEIMNRIAMLEGSGKTMASK